MRIAELPQSREPGDMYASVFVYTTASVTSAAPRADPRINRRVVAHSPLVEFKGNEIQRCWRLRAALAPVLSYFFWKAYSSIKQPLTAHDLIHP